MPSKTVLVFRHAEKPDDPRDPDLSSDGQKHAKFIAKYIPQEFGTPDKLYASAISKHSARPFETLEPLSKAIGVPIDATISDQDCPVLVDDILKDQDHTLIVVCWHHGFIPEICEGLDNNSDYPERWPSDDFDTILKFEFKDSGVTVKRFSSAVTAVR